MKLIVFPQYAKLLSFFRAIASACAADTARWTICRVEPRNGVAHLRDRSMNLLALSGGETRIVLPDIIPGKARQFCLRLSATGENTITFDGASLESAAADSFAPPSDGETVLYTFTETIGDVLFVERRKVTHVN